MKYSGLNLNQDKATKPQTVQIVRQGEATPYWFKFNPLYFYSADNGKYDRLLVLENNQSKNFLFCLKNEQNLIKSIYPLFRIKPML